MAQLPAGIPTPALTREAPSTGEEQQAEETAEGSEGAAHQLAALQPARAPSLAVKPGGGSYCPIKRQAGLPPPLPLLQHLQLQANGKTNLVSTCGNSGSNDMTQLLGLLNVGGSGIGCSNPSEVSCQLNAEPSRLAAALCCGSDEDDEAPLNSTRIAEDSVGKLNPPILKSLQQQQQPLALRQLPPQLPCGAKGAALQVINSASSPEVASAAPPTAAPALAVAVTPAGGAAAWAAFLSHADWGWQMRQLVYAAVFLTPESREVLCSVVLPQHAEVRADHMTLAHKPSVQQVLALPLGAQVVLRIIGQARDGRLQAAAVDPPPWLPPTANAAAHITISIAAGASAVEAGPLMRDALQRAACSDAYASTNKASTYSGGLCGEYEHFDEGLELVGHVGVMLECGRRAFSLDELATVITLDDATRSTYYAMHAPLLGTASNGTVTPAMQVR